VVGILPDQAAEDSRFTILTRPPVMDIGITSGENLGEPSVANYSAVSDLQPSGVGEDMTDPDVGRSPENIIALDSVPHLERYIRRSTEARLAPDKERFEESVNQLERAVALFNDPTLDGLDRSTLVLRLHQLDPDGAFVTAYGNYFANSLAFFRDIFPLGSDTDLSFVRVLTAKLAKRYVKYGDVPELVRNLGITPEAAFEEARRIYDQRGGRMSEDDAANALQHVALDTSVGGLSEESADFYKQTGRPFSGVLKQMGDEMEELRGELGKFRMTDALSRLHQRWMAIRQGHVRSQYPRFSLTQIEEAEKNDPLFGVAGETVDIFIAGLDIADAFGSKAQAAAGLDAADVFNRNSQAAIIRSIFEIIRADGNRAKVPYERGEAMQSST
jgi:hypothetical protein